MQLLFIYILKIIKRIIYIGLRPFDQSLTYIIFYANGIQFSTFKSHGIPKINVGIGGKCSIQSGFNMNNRESSNPIGRFHACSLIVGKEGELLIGKNVGMSATAVVCHDKIVIGNNVNIGGNVAIYDTDFHSLNPNDRLNREEDIKQTKTKPIKIGNNVFIGAHSTILKGVSIGDNAVIGACSLVSKDIPSNEVWAGNPAKFIKLIGIGV